MIVPQTRLVFVAAVVLVPAAFAALAEPAAAPFVAAVVVGLIVVACVDAAAAYRSVKGFQAEFPEFVRLTKDRPAEIRLMLRRDTTRPRHYRLGLRLPADFEREHETVRFHFPEGAERISFDWPCTPRNRGHFELQNAYLEGYSPLGWWGRQRTLPARAELRVYPDFLKERKQVAALFLNRGGFGLHLQRQVGKGREFEQLRDYVPGDSYEDISWKATARRGEPVTKIFQVERTQEVYVILDASRLSARVVRDIEAEEYTTQLERYINAALILGLAAERQGDLYGLVSFSDRVDRFLRARNGKAHFGLCRDALYGVRSKAVNPDFEELCTYIRLRLRKRALLIFLTNLDDPILAESFLRNVVMLARTHLVYVNMLPPPLVGPLFREDDVQSLQDIYDRLAYQMEYTELVELQRKLHHRNVTMSILKHEDMTSSLVSQYMNQRQRQLL